MLNIQCATFNKESYKPVSRILFLRANESCYHLSVPVITHRDQSAYPVPHPKPEFERAALSGTIRGISACKVYPPMMLPSKAVSSYLTFSPFHVPLPLSACGEGLGVRLFSVALSVY